MQKSGTSQVQKPLVDIIIEKMFADLKEQEIFSSRDIECLNELTENGDFSKSQKVSEVLKVVGE